MCPAGSIHSAVVGFCKGAQISLPVSRLRMPIEVRAISSHAGHGPLSFPRISVPLRLTCIRLKVFPSLRNSRLLGLRGQFRAFKVSVRFPDSWRRQLLPLQDAVCTKCRAIYLSASHGLTYRSSVSFVLSLLQQQTKLLQSVRSSSLRTLVVKVTKQES